jgi:predicted dehydrogenase
LATSRPIRIGIAGLGFGLSVHLPALRQIDGVEVAALLGHDPDRVKCAQERTGIPAHTDLDAFLSQDLRAVTVAVPPDEAVQIVSAALERGLPVLCEKPLGPNSQIARVLAKRAARVPCAVDFEFADLVTFRALQHAVAEGSIGRIRHVAVVWLSQSRAHRGGGWSWKTDADRGGILPLFAAHLLYMLELLLGPAEQVSARLDNDATAKLVPQRAARAAADTVVVSMAHRGGGLSSLLVGNASPGLSVHRWTIGGEAGGAVLDNPGGDPVSGFTLDVFGGNSALLSRIHEPAADGDGRIPPFRRLAARFVEAVRTDGRCSPDFNDGARVAALLDVIRQAAKSGRWIDIAP